MITPEQARARFRATADQILAIVRDMEQAIHDGKPCLGCRAGTAAYLCEQLGLAPLMMTPCSEEMLRAAQEVDGERD